MLSDEPAEQTDSTRAATVALAGNLVNAARGGRLDEVKLLNAPDAAVWLSATGTSGSLEESLRTFGAFAAKISNLDYRNIRMTPFDGGYVQQRQLTGIAGDANLELEARIVVAVHRGKMPKLEEYFDSAALAKVGLSIWVVKSRRR